MEENIVKNEIEENVTVDSSVAVEKSAEEVERDLADEVFLDEINKEEKERNAIVEERDEYKKKYLYAIAELENTKKRFANERPNIVKNAKVSVIKSVLDVIDDFERAIKANETVDDIEVLKEGFNNIYKKFVDSMKSVGVEAMDTTDADFNTDVHEAIVMVPTDDESKHNKVVDCIAKGYTLNGDVVRHAKVAVGNYTVSDDGKVKVAVGNHTTSDDGK